LLPPRLFKDLVVGQPVQPLVAQMHDRFSSLTQQVNRRHRHAHVGQEFHAAGLVNRWTSSLASAEA
jgi:hypothetical protein